MKNQIPRVVAAVLLQNDENKFLLTKEILESGKAYWIVPGGKVRFGEKIIDAAKREIKEELGIDIEIKKFLGFKESIHVNHNYHTIIFFFLAKPLTNEIKTSKNVLEYNFFTLEETKNLNLVESADWILKVLAKGG